MPATDPAVASIPATDPAVASMPTTDPIITSMPATEPTVASTPATKPTVASLPITDPSSATPNVKWAVQVPYQEHIDLAYEAWKDANGALLIRRAGENYGVAYFTLNGYIKGAMLAIA